MSCSQKHVELVPMDLHPDTVKFGKFPKLWVYLKPWNLAVLDALCEQTPEGFTHASARVI